MLDPSRDCCRTEREVGITGNRLKGGAAMTQIFKISLFRHIKDNQAQHVDRTWQQLCEL